MLFTFAFFERLEMIYKAFATALTLGLVFSPAVAQESKYFSKPEVTVSDKPTTAAGQRKILIRDRSDVPICPNQGPVIIARCPTGTELVVFDKPIYDSEGFFVICYEKAPYCIPTGIGPEG